MILVSYCAPAPLVGHVDEIRAKRARSVLVRHDSRILKRLMWPDCRESTVSLGLHFLMAGTVHLVDVLQYATC